jgi:hypothetical protein
MPLKTSSGDNVAILIKLGLREHLEMLMAGLVYMNPLKYFPDLNDGGVRGDLLEGTDSIIQPQHVADFRIESGIEGIGGITVNASDLTAPVHIAKQRTSACNLYCMFAVTEAIDGPIFSADHRKFGDSFVLVTNTNEFLRRVGNATQAFNLSATGGLIEYIDKSTHSGGIGRFRKDKEYAHQREFRIVVEPGSVDPIKLQVGDLSDITSEVIPIEDADSVLHFSFADAAAAGHVTA